jgi:hypothetical protein
MLATETTTNEFLQEAQTKARLVYGWDEEETVLPLHLDRDETTRRAGARNQLIYDYAHAIPNEEAIEALAELSPVVELGAGGGYWAYLLRERGAEVVALDSAVEGNEYASTHWTKIEYGWEGSLREYPEHTLFLCWPLHDLTAESALDHYDGQTVVYVGEHAGGCCATSGFFALLERDFYCEKRIDIPRFWGMCDYMTVWKR